MTDKQKSKIIPFPCTKKPIAPIENTVLAELKATLIGSDTEEQASTAPAQMSINGDNITNHGVINHFHGNPEQTVKPPAAISPQQKHRLRNLRDEIVAIAANCGIKKHPATIMVRLNNYMGVEKYDQIKMDDFDNAREWLQEQSDVMASYKAHLHSRTALRTNMIEAITRHGRQTIREVVSESLSTTDLEELYRTVITEK